MSWLLLIDWQAKRWRGSLWCHDKQNDPPLKAVMNHHRSSQLVMVFLFGSSERQYVVKQSSIGPCQFCSSLQVDLIEKQSRFWLWYCIPTPQVTQRMVRCKSCRKCIKAEYYYSTNHCKVNGEKMTKSVVVGTPVS